MIAFVQDTMSNYKTDPKYIGENVSVRLDFVPAEHGGRNIEHDFLLDVLLNERKYGVTIEPRKALPGMGGYDVTISGDYLNVFAIVADQWGSNEDEDSMVHYVGMLLGDEGSTDRWNRGH